MAFCGIKAASEVVCVARGAVVVFPACTGKDALNCDGVAPWLNPSDDNETLTRAVEVVGICGGMTVVTVALTAGAVVFRAEVWFAGRIVGTGDAVTSAAFTCSAAQCRQSKENATKAGCNAISTSDAGVRKGKAQQERQAKEDLAPMRQQLNYLQHVIRQFSESRRKIDYSHQAKIQRVIDIAQRHARTASAKLTRMVFAKGMRSLSPQHWLLLFKCSQLLFRSGPVQNFEEAADQIE